MLDVYPHPEGGRWSGQRMERATAGYVTASYFYNLLSDRIKQPGLDKLKAIADVMGFPSQLWLEGTDEWSTESRPGFAGKGAGFAELLENLFTSFPDARTGDPPTNAEISRRTAGRVSESELARMRSGELGNPTLEQLTALSRSFDVDPAYWFRRGTGRPLVDEHVVEALRSEDNRLILHRSLGLSRDQKDMLLVLMEQLERRGEL